jgi:hypothetical protein
MPFAQNYDMPLPAFPGAPDPPMGDYDFLEQDPYAGDFIPAGGEQWQEDDMGGMMALSSLPQNIQTQEEWDALPPWAKQIHRAMAQGVNLTDADVNRFVVNALQEERRMQQEPQVIEVEEPGTGRKVPYIQTPAGNLQPFRQDPAARTERFVAEDGTVMLLDKETGQARAVTDEAGNRIRAQERPQSQFLQLSGQLDNATAVNNQAQLARKMEEYKTVLKQIETDGPDARVGFLRTKLRDIEAKLREEIAQLEVQAGGAMPQMPQDGGGMPMPGPMPTPEAMQQQTPMPQQTPTPPPNPMPTPIPNDMPEFVRQNGRVFRREGNGYVLVE